MTIGGPLKRVTTNAPDTDTMVPKILAKLLVLLRAIFSILLIKSKKERDVGNNDKSSLLGQKRKRRNNKIC